MSSGAVMPSASSGCSKAPPTILWASGAWSCNRACWPSASSAGDGVVAEYSGRTLRVLHEHGHWQEFIDIDLEGPSITIRIDDCTSATVNLPLSSSASRF
jgi:hypothetical protein